jgi:hypothetical protein
MKSIVAMLGLLAVVSVSPTTAVPASRPVKVFLCAGQSNMGGCNVSAEGPAGLEGRFPAKGIWHRWSDIETKNDKWDAMEAGACGFGPEKMFALEMAKAYPNHQIAILKVQRGATPISFWTPGEANPYNSRLGVKELSRLIRAVSDDLNARKTAGEIPSWEWAGFIWMQGEGDANGVVAPAGTYLKQLKELLAFVRGATATPALPVVLGRISAQLSPRVVRESGVLRFSKAREPDPNAWVPDDIENVDDGRKRGPLTHHQGLVNVRNDQEQFCREDAHAAWIDIDDLPLADAWHYAAAGYMKMGERFAGAYLKLVSAPSVPR